MRNHVWSMAFLFCTITLINAQTARHASHLVPTGKGWGESMSGRVPPPGKMSTSTASAVNGILYHGGPVMAGTVNLYFIWYGNFVNGPSASDMLSTEDLLTELFSASGLGASAYARINSTYSGKSVAVSGNYALVDSMNDYYSQGLKLSDASVAAIVNTAIATRGLPKDSNGVYFVLSSSDVSESSGFCTRYCGWHSHASMAGSDIKFAFVGNPDRCPNACEEEVISPNLNSGADGRASTIAHETSEAITDPDLNAWYDTGGNENSDKCAWKWGPVTGMLGNGSYNMTVAGHKWLIQMNWENSRGGGCDLKLGAKFYNQ